MANPNTGGSVNGLDPKQARATLDLIRKDTKGDIATPEYRATAVWDSGYHALPGMSPTAKW